MSTDDFKYIGPKTPPLATFKAEKKSSFFWIILVIVSIIIFGSAYLVSFLGSNMGEQEKKEHYGKNLPHQMKSAQERKRTEVEKISGMISAEMNAKLQSVENLIARGNLLEARKFLYDLYDITKKTDPAFPSIEELLGKVNIEIFKSDIPCPEKKLYHIQKGDALVKIADRFNTTVEAIQIANRMNPTSFAIYPGQTLCIYQGEWNIKVSISEKCLRLYDGNKLFKCYKIGVGRQGRTPKGEFEISVKQKDPTWYTEGKAIPFGQKDNILGTRWMALAPIGTTDKNLKGYGIHGTWEPESIGQASSNGCIRLKNEDIEELYMLVPIKTKVIIED